MAQAFSRGMGEVGEGKKFSVFRKRKNLVLLDTEEIV